MTREQIKRSNLDTLAQYHETLRQKPQLRQLFFELTLKCNEHCFHCGSSCAENMPDGLELDKYKEILDEVKENFGTGVFIALTGGEPLLYKDFFELTAYIQKLGFPWGITSNGTLITKETAAELKKYGMRSISLSSSLISTLIVPTSRGWPLAWYCSMLAMTALYFAALFL